MKASQKRNWKCIFKTQIKAIILLILLKNIKLDKHNKIIMLAAEIKTKIIHKN